MNIKTNKVIINKKGEIIVFNFATYVIKDGFLIITEHKQKTFEIYNYSLWDIFEIKVHRSTKTLICNI